MSDEFFLVVNLSDYKAPNGWIICSFADLFDIKGGSQPPKSEFSARPQPGYVRLLQIRDFDSDEFAVYIRDSNRWPKCFEDDLLIGRYGASLGKICTGKSGAYNVALAKLIFDRNNLDKGWVEAFLRSRWFQAPLFLVSRSAQNGFNKDELFPRPVLLPPLNEQRRIVAKIETLMARRQRVKEALEAIPPLLDQFRQSVLVAAFRGDLTVEWREKNTEVEPASVLLERIQEKFDSTHQSPKKSKNQKTFGSLDQEFIDTNFEKLPESWQLTQIKKILISSFYGPRFGKDEYVFDGIPSIRTTDMTDDGEIILQDPPKLKISKDRLDDFKVLPGDLLVTRSGSIGVMAVFRGNYVAIPSAYLIRFRFSHLVSVDYIFYYFKSPIGQKILGLNSTAVTQSNINAEAIKNIPIPIPPLEEQKEIVYKIQSIFKQIAQFKQQYQEAKAYLDQLNQSILAKAFRGGLVPQDPNDEPASVLLERIRTERAKREAEAKVAKKSTGNPSGRRGRKAKQQDSESIQLELPGLE